MLSRFKACVPSLARTYMALAIPKGQRPSPKGNAKDPKAKLRAFQQKKSRAKQNPELHPLYMEVPNALRYLRAAEVGQPAKKTTITVTLNVVPDQGAAPLKGQIFYPKPVKETHGLVFTEDANVASEIAAIDPKIMVGGPELVESIKEGKVKLDGISQCFASPEMFKNLKVIARILGPKGIMPTPKRNTVTEDLSGAIKQNFGAITFRQKGYALSVPVGRCDFSDYDVLQNLKAARDAIYQSHREANNVSKKQNTIGQAWLSSTLGPSIVINFKPL